MKYTCIIIRYNLRVRNFLTKGLGTRTYFTLQRERKSETIMLLSTCAELLALFLKKINNLFLQCKKLLPGLGAKSTTGRTAEMKWYICPLWSIPTSNIHIHRSDTCLLDHHHQFSHCLKHTLSHISPEDVYPMRVSCKLDTENWCRWSYYTSIPMWSKISLNDCWSRMNKG